jgi:hypothetical protein
MPDPNVAEDSSDDIGADLERNWDDQVGSEDDSSSTSTALVDTPSAPAPTDAASKPSPSSEATGPGAGRSRGPDGKYVKAEKAAPMAAPAAPAAPGATPFKAPETWPADVRARLEKLYGANPDDAQWVAQQYDFMRRAAAQQHAKAQEYLKGYEQFLAPGRQQRALNGIDDGTHIRHLLAADDFLRKAPKEAIKWLAQANGIDLSAINAPNQGEPEVPAYVRDLQTKQQQIIQHLSGQTREQEVAELNRMGSYLNQVAEATDQTGNKLFPHFDEVINEIIVAVQHQQANGQQPDVPAAYRTAVRLNDAVWLKVQTAEREATKKAAETQRLKDIEDAKRAGLSLSGSGADTRESPPEDIGKALLRNWDRLSN